MAGARATGCAVGRTLAGGAGAVLVSEGVIANGEPDSSAVANCSKLGKALAEV